MKSRSERFSASQEKRRRRRNSFSPSNVHILDPRFGPGPRMTERSATQEQDGVFDTYMKDVSRHALLTAEEERELGQTLMERRNRYWHEVLSYAPYTIPVVDIIQKSL